jgi:RHS repeat-associated protein
MNKRDQYPVATLEDGAGLAIEKNYYDITDANIVSRTAAYNAASGSSYPNNNGNPPYNTNPGSTTAAESQKLYKLNGSTGSKTGLGITLKVMAGDEVFIYGKSFYHLNAAQTPNNTFGIIVNNLLGLFAGTNAVAGAGKGATAAALTSSPTIPAATQNILNNTPATAAGQPKAYINWILFNEQFQPVLSGSSADRVGVAEEIKSHQQQVQIGTSGYLYVYCSNESDVDVFFDNLQLVHQRGALLEETHYYPFGLTMAGISSKAAGSLDNKYKFNGIEQNNDLDLNMLDAYFRNLDPQTGRFWQIDPKLESEEMQSPYSAMNNNSILYADPLGDIVRNAHDEEVNLARQRRDAANAALKASMQKLKVEDKNISRKDFLAAGHTKEEWKDFKSTRNSADKAESRLTTATKNQFDAQEDINQMQHDNPTLFNAVNNWPIDVFVGRTDNGAIVDAGGGGNAIRANGNTIEGRMFNLDDLSAGSDQWRQGIAIWTLNGRGQDVTIVKHEFGHAASMYGGVAALGIGAIPYGGDGNPTNAVDYVRNFSRAWGAACGDCRAGSACNPTSAAAIAAERLPVEAADRYARRINPNR